MSLVVKKLFQGITGQYANMSLWNRGVIKTNQARSMVSYYEESDLYLPHDDVSVVTVLYWVWKEPKSFTGGDFILHDVDEIIPVTNNTLLLFPGHCTHSVSPVRMNADSKEGFGRWCVTTFLLTGVGADSGFECYLTDGGGHQQGLP
jgi:Rps23 Pro-64 3,4-dihydroxylase Tpa1-like proline 4-hydroxylase